ncbi:MAG: hypothetical protein QM762_12515 [Chryseolinea sp.]
MSWSIKFIGAPANVVAALKKHSEQLEGQSKKEFDAALPHLTGLVEQNFNKVSSILIDVEASGHGTSDDSYRNCVVSVKQSYGTIV